MTRTQAENEVLNRFVRWSDIYLNDQTNSLEDLQAYRLKRDHSLRVVSSANRIVELSNKLTEETKMLVNIAATLHDVGRFEQWKTTKNFSDVAEPRHPEIGAKMLARGLIKYFIPWTREYDEILILAVREHGSLKLPAGLTNQQETICNLLRDSDRADIFYQCSTDRDFSILYRQDWGKTILSDNVRTNFEKGETIRYEDVKSKLDMLALRLVLCNQMSCRASVQYLLEDDSINRMVAKFKEQLRSEDGNLYYNEVEVEWLRKETIKRLEKAWRELE